MIQISALAIISTCLILAIKNEKPEITVLLSILTGVIILSFLVPQIQEIIDGVKEISGLASVNADAISILLKVVGIVYITEFASGVCKDAKEEGTAVKVQIAGKVIILGIALPLMMDILKMITGILK